MRRVMIAIAIATLPLQADDYGMLARAIAKLIDENRQMRSEILLLKGGMERLQGLEQEVARLREHPESPVDANRTEAQVVQSEEQNFLESFRPYRAVVTADKLNVRAGLGPQYGIFNALYEGNTVSVVEKAPGGWNRISWGDNMGWVFSYWLEPLTKEGEDE
jgi:uncharacterized protein YgiM (DUF1202 family)